MQQRWRADHHVLHDEFSPFQVHAVRRCRDPGDPDIHTLAHPTLGGSCVRIVQERVETRMSLDRNIGGRIVQLSPGAGPVLSYAGDRAGAQSGNRQRFPADVRQ